MQKIFAFFVTLVSIYVALVTAAWGFVEAFTYFQGDSLKRMLGECWVWLYVLPLVISLCISIIRIILPQKEIKAVVEAEFVRKPDTSIPSQKSGKYFRYKGLVWKRARLRFQKPTPICPVDNCYRPIDCYRINPPQYLISANIRDMQDFLNKQNTYNYIYKCPLHGEIQNAPNQSRDDLTREAKYEQNR